MLEIEEILEKKGFKTKEEKEKVIEAIGEILDRMGIKFQIVTRRRPRYIQYIRIYDPRRSLSMAEILSRVTFGYLASRAKGKKFKEGDKFLYDLPPACYEVMKMKGMSFEGKRVKLRKWERVLMNVLEGSR